MSYSVSSIVICSKLQNVVCIRSVVSLYSKMTTQLYKLSPTTETTCQFLSQYAYTSFSPINCEPWHLLKCKLSLHQTHVHKHFQEECLLWKKKIYKIQLPHTLLLKQISVLNFITIIGSLFALWSLVTLTNLTTSQIFHYSFRYVQEVLKRH